ncbi:hypothetical protein P5G65_23620 [Paenibacillus chondroitinus]|uniref:DUF4321 domain-containing protein n=2 Tax=Paenibacillus TaxID=44249 RepID=A0ABU6DHQ3_9BACL|nr:hypothetical protein [Paenibacillus chondroitinus]MEB4796895.1 hypothetical protein [Paenibacillus chondroitinus]
MWEKFKKDPWLKLIAGSSIILMIGSFVEFLLSRFNASTPELGMKMMRGMFLSTFMKDVLDTAIQGVILLLLIGAGVGMFLVFRRILKVRK